MIPCLALSKRRLGHLATAIVLGLCAWSRAAIVGPYAVDADTLHLWQLNEANVPALDSVSAGTNLTALGGSASLGHASYSGFGTALSTATTIGDYLAPRALSSDTNDNTIMAYDDPTTGAFTYEATIRVDFNPATFNRGNVPLSLLCAENEAGDRPFQFRIHTNGVAGSGALILQFFNLTGVGNTPFVAAIPITGPDAIAQGQWYHVAVTFDGAVAGGHLCFYWTLMDQSRLQANLIASATMPNLVPLVTTGGVDFSLGNVGRNMPNAGFVGLLDEVRMSRVARAPTGMMFGPTNVVILTSPASQTVPLGQPVNLSVSAAGLGPLSYQWRFDSAPISGGTRSAYGIGFAQLTNSGSYDVVVTNVVSAATSAVARLTVAAPELIWLRIARLGTNLTLSWPASASTLALYCASNLTPPVDWRAVTIPAALSNGNNAVTLTPGNGSSFFRLLTPPRSDAVRAPDWSAFQAGTPEDSNSLKVISILRHACKYAVTTWWNAYYAAQDSTNYLSFGGTQESQIRRPAMEAFGLAVALQTETYDPAFAGVSVADARSRTLKLVRSLAYRHRVNQAGGWGNDWQTALWASLAGTAGWMLWTDLPATDQEYVRRMVEYEANRFTNYAVPYYMNRSGTILYPGDTKCEENAWNASVLHLALCMMPAHLNTAPWWNKALELSLSAHARPSDINRTNVFHGRPLAAWLNGSNANEDSTVINHSIVHPDYMVAGLSEFQPALVYLLADRPVPQAGFFNLDHTYRALVDLSFVVGAAPYPTGLTNRTPGGFLYARDASNQPTTNIYYPNGNDWGTMRRMHFATMDAMVHAFGLDGLASLPSDLWEAQQDQAVIDMQARFTDGRTYGASAEDTYALREEWVCCSCAKSFLTKWLVHQSPVRISNEAGNP